jgi:hypothetical protein
MRIDSKIYQNLILTVIAVLLLLVAFQVPMSTLDPTAPVQAERRTSDDDEAKAWQIKQDPLVAQATKDVAAANIEISKQIGRVAVAIEKLAENIDHVAGSLKE